MEIFKQKELAKSNFIQRLFGIKPSENAFIEINNLFASNQFELERIRIEQIIDIANKYKTNLTKAFKNERINLYREYVRCCLSDNKLEESEVKILRHLKELLLLNEKDTANIIDSELEKCYDSNVEGILNDGKIDNSERQKLEQLKKDLHISEDVANKIYKKNANETLQKFIDGAISDKKLSPEEEIEINEISKSLGIDIQVNEKTTAILEKYKLYWQIENAELPEIESDIKLQKYEKLHYSMQVKWLEQRRITKRINYAGPGARIRLAKGIYYRVGSLNMQRITEDVWQTIDTGTIYLTDKRIIFMGSKGNKTLGLNKILNLIPYSNGLEIQKDSGKSPFLEFSPDVDIFSMILARLIDES